LRPFDILCLTPARWGDRVRRLQHLMRAAARSHRVVVIEQAANLTEDAPIIACPDRAGDGLRVFRPADRYWSGAASRGVRTSMRAILGNAERDRLVVWANSPQVLSLVSADSRATLVCDFENPLATGAGILSRADLLVAAGTGAFQASRHLHPNVYLFPHAVDVEHFTRARSTQAEPADQALIPHPRVGFWGTVDERMHFALLDSVARLLPHIHFVMIGAMEHASRYRTAHRPNVHWLGERPYTELPAYVAGWDAAILPYARNEATRFLSPAQIPEFLAAGRRVVSTTLRDVQHPYGASGLVAMADTPEEFAAAIESARRDHSGSWRATADRYLKALSWQSTWGDIEHLVNALLERRAISGPISDRSRRSDTRIPVGVMH